MAKSFQIIFVKLKVGQTTKSQNPLELVGAEAKKMRNYLAEREREKKKDMSFMPSSMLCCMGAAARLCKQIVVLDNIFFCKCADSTSHYWGLNNYGVWGNPFGRHLNLIQRMMKSEDEEEE